MTTREYKIEGMSCGHCIMALNKELSKLDLHEKHVEIGLMKISYNELKVNEEQIINAVEEAGYKVAR
ncbi:MAG: heavy-metal-associated domain-containing protein [Melioribacteraceae bacterium]|nr:heavy-metal-associated domain-containing protein [Melioribacteraceae bacterium]